MTTITRTRNYEAKPRQMIIGSAGTVAVEWHLLDERDQLVESAIVGHEVADQPPDVQAAVATIMAWASTVADDSATAKQADEDAKIAEAVAAKRG